MQVCVCVCVYIYIYIYLIPHLTKNINLTATTANPSTTILIRQPQSSVIAHLFPRGQSPFQLESSTNHIYFPSNPPKQHKKSNQDSTSNQPKNLI